MRCRCKQDQQSARDEERGAMNEMRGIWVEVRLLPWIEKVRSKIIPGTAADHFVMLHELLLNSSNEPSITPVDR